jgi:hypothetical protein
MCSSGVNSKETAAFRAESGLFRVFCHSVALGVVDASLLHFVATQIV